MSAKASHVMETEGTMKHSDHRFWPFRASTSAVTSLGMFLLIVTVMMVVHWKYDKPIPLSENTILIGLLVFSFLPVVLALVDFLIERGGVLKYGDFQIELSRFEDSPMRGLTIPPNVGVVGRAVSDSDTTHILDVLKDATSCDVAIVDLEDGQAWWETRLLVLLAGAERLKRPQKVVFVGTDRGKPKQFRGWAHPDELLRCLLKLDEQYRRSLFNARAAGRQWELVEPVRPVPPAPVAIPTLYPWMTTGLPPHRSQWAFDPSTGLPNELLLEQLLAADLGQTIEMNTNFKPRTISLGRLTDIFGDVLFTEHLDRSWSSSCQSETFFRLQQQFIAVTNNGAYELMVSKLDVLAEMMRQNRGAEPVQR